MSEEKKEVAEKINEVVETVKKAREPVLEAMDAFLAQLEELSEAATQLSYKVKDSVQHLRLVQEKMARVTKQLQDLLDKEKSRKDN